MNLRGEDLPGNAALLRGSAALVTGGGRGIGLGISRELTAAGADVALVGRTRADLDAAAAEARAHGVQAEVFPLDLLDRSKVQLAVDLAFDAMPHLDVLVNNAGHLVFNKCWEYAPEEYRAIIDTNLTAPFLLCQAFARRWVEQGVAGRIVNIASVESEVAYPDQAPYAASKGGVLALTKVMARELGGRGIRVNAIGPGPIATPISLRFREVSEQGVVFHRLGEPEEVGRAVVFLASSMSSFVTGTILYVDGGYMLS